MSKFDVYDEGTNFPAWALGYIHNGDASGLEDDEIAAVDAWAAKIPTPCILSTFEDENFDHRPLFGLPCTCVGFVVLTPKVASHA